MAIRPLPKELREKAQRELNEVPERVQDDLKHIRDWISKQTHLRARTDDQTLITFLRNAKFSLERTKEKIDAFYTMKTLTKDILKERNPLLPEIQHILEKSNFSVSLDTSTHLAPVLLIVNWEYADFQKLSVHDFIKIRLMILDILTNEYDAVVINGLRVIEDFKGFSLANVPQFTPTICKLYITSMQDVYPVRFEGGCVVNAPAYIETVYGLVKPFLKEKIRNRVTFYSGAYIGISDEFPASVLPNEYGGEAGSLKELSAKLKKKMESYSDWFLEDAQYGTDESKRRGKPKTAADMFGVDGSFRKLNID